MIQAALNWKNTARVAEPTHCTVRLSKQQYSICHRSVAQLAERRSPNAEVVGSIPTWPVWKSNAVTKDGVLNLKEECQVAQKEEKQKKPNIFQKIGRFWRETIGELRKVTWPTTKEAWELTKVVLLVTVVMSLLLGIMDYGFSQLIGLLVAS